MELFNRHFIHDEIIKQVQGCSMSDTIDSGARHCNKMHLLHHSIVCGVGFKRVFFNLNACKGYSFGFVR